RVPEHRVPARGDPDAAPAGRGQGPLGGGAVPHHAVPRPSSAAVVGRRAPARRAVSRAGARSQAVPVRRTAREPGCEIAPRGPRRTLLGFRPEDLRPRSAFGAGEEVYPIRFHVLRVEYLGADRYGYGTVPDSRSPEATVIARLPGDSGPQLHEGASHAFAVPRR